MEAKNIIFVVLLGIAAYRWYPASEHNILVLVNSATYDPSRISQVKGLKSAFKIERNIDDTLGRDYHWEQKAKSQWKIALIIKNDVDGKQGYLYSKKVRGEGWGDIRDDVLTALDKELRSYDFIMNIAMIPYTENMAWTKFQNFYWSSLKTLSTKYPDWFDFTNWEFMSAKKEDMEGKIYAVLCDERKIAAAGDKEQIVINANKLGEDVDSLKTHDSLITKFHAKTETKMMSMGKADADYWDNIAILSYPSRDKFCELTMSKQFQEAFPYRKNGIKDAHTYLATKILDCNEKVQKCTPV